MQVVPGDLVRLCGSGPALKVVDVDYETETAAVRFWPGNQTWGRWLGVWYEATMPTAMIETVGHEAFS